MIQVPKYEQFPSVQDCWVVESQDTAKKQQQVGSVFTASISSPASKTHISAGLGFEV